MQTLDGDAHRRRKHPFMSVMAPGGVARLAELTARGWRECGERWRAARRVVLFDEAGEPLCRTACEWAGVPLSGPEVGKRTRDFEAMIDSPAAVGPRHWRGRRARSRAERWVGNFTTRTTAAPAKGRRSS